MPALLKRLNEQPNIIGMPKETLKACLIDAGKEAGQALVQQGVEWAKNEAKSQLESAVTTLKKAGTEVGKKVNTLYEGACEKIQEGWERAVQFKDAVFDWFRGNKASEEAKLEDDFGIYLQKLFDENPIEDVDASPREVEQKTEEGTGLFTQLSNGIRSLYDKAVDFLSGPEEVDEDEDAEEAIRSVIVHEEDYPEIFGESSSAQGVAPAATQTASSTDDLVYDDDGEVLYDATEANDPEPALVEGDPKKIADAEKTLSDVKPEAVPETKGKEAPMAEKAVASNEQKKDLAAESSGTEATAQPAEDGKWFFQRWFGW